ncbi:hypothetical protein DFJ77DRAFT_265918 [Powellomyces hirtus]|nr:hypothetical protein DFJ77DRAFT_265918 [Powellomyces hirtus]
MVSTTATKVESYNPKNDKYKLTFSSGHCRSLRRQDFHTPFEPVFKEVELGNIAPCEYDNGTPSPAYEDPGLEREIHRALPQIRRLANDIPIKDHRRCQMFFQKAGGIKELEAQLCYGPFDIQQADLIARTLMKEVFGIAVHYSQSDGDEAIAEEKLPSPTSKNDISAIAAQTAAALLHPSASSSPMPSASTPKTDKFTRLVLVPETIIQILMHRNSPEITYAAAEREMHLASRKLRMDYVTEILTARQCAELGESVRKQSRTMG